MKLVVRTLALTLVVTGFAADALAHKSVTPSRTVAAGMPIPSCPWNSGGCGIWK